MYLLYIITIIAGKPEAPTNINISYRSPKTLGLVDIGWSYNYEKWQYGIPHDFDIYCKYGNKTPPTKVITNHLSSPFLYQRTLHVLPYSKCWCFIQAVSSYGQGLKSLNFSIKSTYETGIVYNYIYLINIIFIKKYKKLHLNTHIGKSDIVAILKIETECNLFF